MDCTVSNQCGDVCQVPQLPDLAHCPGCCPSEKGATIVSPVMIPIFDVCSKSVIRECPSSTGESCSCHGSCGCGGNAAGPMDRMSYWDAGPMAGGYGCGCGSGGGCSCGGSCEPVCDLPGIDQAQQAIKSLRPFMSPAIPQPHLGPAHLNPAYGNLVVTLRPPRSGPFDPVPQLPTIPGPPIRQSSMVTAGPRCLIRSSRWSAVPRCT